MTEKREDGIITYQKPQGMLTAMMSAVAFDPEGFLRMSDRGQADALAAVAGLDTSDLDAQYKELFDDRTVERRQLKAMGTVPPPDGEKPEPVDVDALWKEVAEAEEAKRVKDELSRQTHDKFHERTSGEREIRRAEDDILERQGEIEEAQKEIIRQRARIDLLRTAAADVQGRIEALEAKEKNIGNPEIRIAELHEAIREGESVARDIARREAAERALKDRQSIERSIDAATDKLAEIKADRAKRVAECNMPVEGLSIDEDGVLYDGPPLRQTSHAQRLDVSLAVGMAQNPMLKVLRLENASLLDAKTMAVIEARCAKKGYQCWAERVADVDTGVGLYIEDGVLAEREEDG